VLFQHLATNDSAVDVACRVDTAAFGAAVLFGGRFHILDEVFHRAVAGAADADAFLPARFVFAPGFGIGDVHSVVFGDVDAAGTAELRPGVDVIAVLIEDLNAIVGTIADEETPARIDGDGVGRKEFAGARAFVPPGLDGLAVA
jgi:hypothetical protein